MHEYCDSVWLQGLAGSFPALKICERGFWLGESVISYTRFPKSVSGLQVFKSIPYCIDLLEGPYIQTKEEIVKAFRPADQVRKAA